MHLSDFFHVVNPNQAQSKQVAQFFQTQPALRYQWVEKQTHPTHLETILEWARVEGEKNICVWGGDGTLNRTLQYLYSSRQLPEFKCGLVPVGTCNDFFRKARQLQDRNAVEYDLGIIESAEGDRVFLNNAGFGRTPAALRRKKSKPIRDILAFSSKKIQIKTSETSEPPSGKVFLGMICNAPYFSGGLHFSSKPNPTDGYLNVYFEREQNKLNLIYKFIKGKFGFPLQSSTTWSMDVKNISIESDQKMYFQVDGEKMVESGLASVKIKTQSRCLSLYVFDRPF